MSTPKQDFDELVNILNDIINASDANDGEALLNCIATAKDWLFDLELLATQEEKGE